MTRRHKHLVESIANKAHAYYERQQPFHIYHGSTNSTRILSFKRSQMIDTSKLNQVLKINSEKRTALIEPNVSMDNLVAATLKKGLLPPVVTEFPGITVGGGIQGGAGESSSFRYGCLNQSCLAYEIVLGDGKTLKVSPKVNADLFFGTAGSYGSLGIITAVELRLIPAHKYVQLTYTPVTSFESAVSTMEEAATKNYDYIDGIMFGAHHGVIMAGKLSDKPYGKVRRFSRAHDPWFYLHAEAIDKRAHKITESIPIKDYLFRYDRGAFWVARYAFDRFGVRFSPFTRWLLNPILHARKLYQSLQASGASQQYIVQDLALPRKNAAKFMKFVNKHFGAYPIWLCPLKVDAKSPLQLNNINTSLAINVGVWGPQINKYEDFLESNKNIEAEIRKLGGKKWFYAHSYYTEKEFWSIYDKPNYDKLRQKYSANYLPSVYQKISISKRYPVNAKRGLLKTLFGRPKLRVGK